MNNYVAVIEYDGSNYKGFQYQPGKIKTIQDELQKVLSILLGKDVFEDFSYSGRTDTGVHAKYQVINFKTDKFLDLYKFKWQLNCLLPEDIVAKDIRLTDEHFDSRKDAKLREYSYFVVNNDFQSAFLKKYSLLVTKKLDVQMMRKAAEMFVGTFDFRSFCSSNFQAGSTIRRIYGFKIRCFSDGLIVFKIAASSFLYNMVRIIIGTVLEAGRGKRNLESIDKALKGASRKLAGKIVPAKGLFLTKVIY
jgi:tRNA pseudouridine38-40 synthase